MIRLTRGGPPPVLDLNGSTWTDEYVKRKGGDESISAAAETRYRHPEIKEALKRDSHNKCAYCESYPTAVSPGDVEHIEPKSIAPARIVDWTNLLFSCSLCNANKRDYWSPGAPILNPYLDDPGLHLEFVGPMALARTPSGEITRAKLRLNRVGLLERRSERLEMIESLLSRLVEMGAGPERTALEGVILEEAADDQEFAATVRAFLSVRGVTKPEPVSG